MTQFDSHILDGRTPAAFYFTVSFGDALGVADCQFQEVSGIAAEMATASAQEGGENRFVPALPKAIKHSTLVLKRGVAPLSATLLGWCREVLEGGLAASVKTRQVRVSLMDAAGQPLRVWVFEQAFPVKWTVEGLGSSRQDVAIEQVALQYQSVTREV